MRVYNFTVIYDIIIFHYLHNFQFIFKYIIIHLNTILYAVIIQCNHVDRVIKYIV